MPDQDHPPETAACAFGDPTCPCQDGDVCHYVDDPISETLAMTPPTAATGLDGEPCRSRSDNCPHTMVARCPGCHREMYALGVWDFSHGDVSCQCGYVVTPRQRQREVAWIGDQNPDSTPR